jgi:ribosome-associated translation inhibitor RaiA
MTDFLIPRGKPGDSVRARLSALLAARGIKPARVTVEFVDQNGQKGGPGVRCAANVTLARHPALHVESIDTTPARAFDAVLQSLDRQLLRLVGRLRDRARRPKKYFAAKRLLTGTR